MISQITLLDNSVMCLLDTKMCQYLFELVNIYLIRTKCIGHWGVVHFYMVSSVKRREAFIWKYFPSGFHLLLGKMKLQGGHNLEEPWWFSATSHFLVLKIYFMFPFWDS